MISAEEVKNKIDLIEYLQGYMTMKRAGSNFKALCPFHKENTPSLVISPDRQIWKCFGCGASGDIISFVMKFENIEFVDALKALADHAGIKMESAGWRKLDSNSQLYEVMEAASRFYQEHLIKNKEAVEYLRDRGMSKETIVEFRIGFAPNSFDALTSYLAKKGFRVGDTEKAGLIIKSKKGMYFDRFRGRIMFPIMNHVGKPVAFTGRVIPSVVEEERAKGRETAKYMNSPETPIFKKSKILYGFHVSKIDIRKQDKAFLVEGQMDYLFSRQDGVGYAVATSGTSLTEEHLATLRNYTENLILGFDNDKAGAMAAERSIDMANALDFNVSIVRFDDFKDAADLVAAHPGRLAKKLETETQSAMEYYFDRYAPANMSPVEEKHAMRTLLSKIGRLSSSLMQAQWIKALSEKTGIAEQFLIAEMQAIRSDSAYAPADAPRQSRAAAQPSPDPSLSRPKRRIEHIAESLLALVFEREDLREHVEAHVHYFPEMHGKAYRHFMGDDDAEEGVRELVNDIRLRAGMFVADKETDMLEEEVRSLLHNLQMEWLKERRGELVYAVKQAEQNNNAEQLERSLHELHEISERFSGEA